MTVAANARRLLYQVNFLSVNFYSSIFFSRLTSRLRNF